MEYIYSALIGYLFGCVNPAYILGRINGFDIRERGSHNAGASNAKLTLGWWAFFVVLVYDFFKSYLAILLVKNLFPGSDVYYIIAGSFAVIGHIYPFYLGFVGGKGFACYIGFVYFINIYVGLALTVVGLILAYITNWIVSCTMTFVIGFPIIAYFINVPMEGVIAATIVSLIMIYKHRINFIRVREGEEFGIFRKEVVKCFLKKDVKERLLKEGVIK